MSAGHDGEHFYLQSGDGGFLMNLYGQIQARYTMNSRDNSSDDFKSGFTVPRAKLGIMGHIADPRLGYELRLAVNEDTNDANFEVAKISYQLRDDLSIWGGEDKDPFLREELVSSAHQLAVERSLVNEVFTMGYVQGIGVDWTPSETIRVRGTLNDGIRSGEADNDNDAAISKGGSNTNDKPFADDASDFALTGRVDVKLAGDWDQANDFTAWSGEEMAAFVGGAVHYEVGETGSSAANNNFLAWTVDGSFEQQGWNAFAALNGMRTDYENGGDRELYGFVAQGGYNIDDTYEPFVRYEYLNLDSNGSDHINIVTAGLNWFNNQHNAKFTADVVWALDTIPSASAH